MANTWHTHAEEAGPPPPPPPPRAHKDSGGDDMSPYKDREQRGRERLQLRGWRININESW